MFQSLLSLLLAGSLSLGSWTGTGHELIFDDKSLLSVSILPHKNEEIAVPASLSAQTALAVDLKTQSRLYEKSALTPVPIASLTKLMTAALILEENDPHTLVTVSTNAADTPGSHMGLYAGEQISVLNLLYGLFIVSGNDAAVALAEFNAGTEAAFIEKMNGLAQKLGLQDTHYNNTTGLDSGEAYSTARDLITLSTHLLQDESVREIVKNSKITVESTTGDRHELINTNILLGQMGISGLKTGKTPAAGECFIALALSPEGHEILSVVLGSQNRFVDTKILLDWIDHAYSW